VHPETQTLKANAMSDSAKLNTPPAIAADDARGAGTANSLLPMLVGGLVLITIGMLVLMVFV
jgi:hypothetical protein